MPLDLNNLTPAPWHYEERIGMAAVFAGVPPECLIDECPRCIASKSASLEGIQGWVWNPADLADMEFIALARNAFDVMARR